MKYLYLLLIMTVLSVLTAFNPDERVPQANDHVIPQNPTVNPGGVQMPD